MAGLACAAERDEVAIVHHLRADESALEIAVDSTGGSRRAVSAADGPGLHLIFSNGEKRDQVEQSVSGSDETSPRGLGDPKRLEKLALILGLELRDFRFPRGGKRERIGSACLRGCDEVCLGRTGPPF